LFISQQLFLLYNVSMNLNHANEILYRLFISGSSVSGTILARQLNVSIKTLRKDIAEINEIVGSRGFSIVSHKGDGYAISVSDEDACAEFRDKIVNNYLQSYYYSSPERERVHYIIRRLCTSEHRVTISSIADELNYSQSMISKDMNTVRTILEMYSVQLSSDKYGMYLSGSEWNLRALILFEFHIKMHNSLFLEAGETEFQKLVISSLYFYEKSRSIIEAQVINAPFLFSLQHIETLVNYVELGISRKKYSSRMSFSEEDRALLQSDYGKISLNIYQEIESAFPYRFTEGDRIGLAVLLNAFAENPMRAVQIRIDRKDLFDYMRQFRADLFTYDESSELQASLVTSIENLLAQLQYQRSHQIFFSIDSSRSIMLNGLLHMEECYCFSEYLRQKFGLRLLDYETCAFYFLFSNYTYHIITEKKPRIRVLSVSRIDKTIAEHNALMYERLNPRITADISCANYAELTPEMQRDADIVITDLDRQMDSSRFIHQPVRIEYKHFYTMPEFRINDLSLSEKKARILFPRDNFFELDRIKSRSELFQFCREHVLPKYHMPEEFLSEIQEKDDIIPLERANSIAILSPFHSFPGFPSFACVIYTHSPFIWSSHPVQIIILLHISEADRVNMEAENIISPKGFHQTGTDILSGDAVRYENFLHLFYGSDL